MTDLFVDSDPRFQLKGIPDCVRLGHLYNVLQDSLLATGHVEKAALINISDGSIKAETVGFKIDVDMWIRAFKSPLITRSRGINFNNINYQCVRAEPTSIYCKQGGNGLVAIQTHSLILVAFYNQQMFASVAVEAVESLGDYLREKEK